MLTTKTTVKAALNTLAKDQKFSTRLREIRRIVDNWHITPMVFAGDLTIYNVFVELGLADRNVLDKLLVRAQAMRPTNGKSEYQREYMRARRRRLQMAELYQESVLGRSMTRSEAAIFRADIQRRWNKQRDDVIHKCGDMTWEEKNAAIAAFWDKIDAGLESLLRAGDKS